MLPKSQRLNLKKDFKWVASGKQIDTKYMKLFLKTGDPSTLRQAQGSGPRIGIAVSSQVFKKATLRNRAKRLISQAFQATIYHLPSTINIVVLPKADILGVKSQDVLLDLEEKLKYEKIIS